MPQRPQNMGMQLSRGEPAARSQMDEGNA
jgi:hypothetical protein